MNSRLLLCLPALLLCGCPKPQPYSQPPLPVPDAWPSAGAGPVAGVDGTPAARIPWREFFTDDRLKQIIELALQNNRDLRIAALNSERVRAAYQIQLAEKKPTVGVTGGMEAYRLPEKLAGGGEAETIGQFQVGFGFASWELDFFGRIRSLTSFALEQYLATEAARSAAQITIVSAVAETWLAVSLDQENLRLAQSTLETQKSVLELIRHTRDVGIASDLDYRQAESQVEAVRVDIARYEGRIELGRNALELLAGAPVPTGLLPDRAPAESPFRDVSPGIPSEVLLARPDIVAAEHQLKALYANLEAARANFFPRISLTAGVGLISGSLLDLFEWGSRTWTFVPQLQLPVFDQGRRQAAYEASVADRDLAVAEYERAIQAAFRETADALVLRKSLLEQEEAQKSLAASLAEAHRLAEARYRAGIDGYLGVLVAQRALYAAEQGLAGLRTARLLNQVALYRALGGGA